MRRYVACLYFLFIMLIIGGCATKIQHTEIAPLTAVKLESGQSVYVALAQDGAYGSKKYPGSGTQVAHFLAMELRSHVSDMRLATNYAPVEDVLTTAHNFGARYVFIPVITNWEPRAAYWSKLPTRVSMTITVHDLAFNEDVIIHKIDITGRTLTILSQSADALAAFSIKEFCSEIF